MNFNWLLLTASFLAANPVFPPIKDQMNIESWKKQTLEFDNGSITVSFPKTATQDADGNYSVTDNDGMTFKVIAMKDIPMKEGMNFLLKTVEGVPGNQIIYKEPSSDPQNRSTSAAWVTEDGQFSRVTAIQGKKDLIFLQTLVTDPLFKKLDNMNKDPSLFERVKKDSDKNQAFVLSLEMN